MTDVRHAGIPADTSVEAWHRHVEAVRALTPAERIASWEQFQTALERTQRDAVRRAYPDVDERTLVAILVRRRHGAELARNAYPDIDIDAYR